MSLGGPSPRRHRTKITRSPNSGKKPSGKVRKAIEATLKANPNFTPAEVKAALASKFPGVTTDNVTWVKNNK